MPQNQFLQRLPVIFDIFLIASGQIVKQQSKSLLRKYHHDSETIVEFLKLVVTTEVELVKFA